jgi:signal transduction histidine kinase
LLTQLIEIIKLEEKISDIKEEDIKLSSVLEDEISRYKIDLEGKNVTLEMDLDRELVVVGDEFKIRQVLTNLMSNAVSYVGNSGKLRVKSHSLPSLGEGTNNQEVLVEIINTGSSIPEDKLENIWKAFYRVEGSRNRKYGGTGLGLTIVSEILKRHGSQFGVENTEDGVKFWFTLKRKQL